MSETIEPGVAEGFGAIGVVVSGFSSLTAAMGVRYFGGDFENPNYLFFIFMFGSSERGLPASLPSGWTG